LCAIENAVQFLTTALSRSLFPHIFVSMPHKRHMFPYLFFELRGKNAQ